MNILFYKFLKCFFVVVTILSLWSCHNQHEETSPYAVSLCKQLVDIRYSNVSRFDSVADILYTEMEDNREMRAVADNALAYVAMMRMDYAKANGIYSDVIENSCCEIERLVADVGLMTVCYRVSENRRFFDCRSKALSRIKRINEEFELLSKGDKERFVRAKIEFAIVSVCYFSNLGMQQEKKRALEYLEKEIQMTEDAGLRLYAKMILANNVPDAIQRLELFSDGTVAAKEYGYAWLEANYNLLLAINLRDSVNLRMFKEHATEAYASIASSRLSDYGFLLDLITKAVDGFKVFGDRYMMIEALAVSASCCVEYGYYDDALYYISEALAAVNEYYRYYYPLRSDLCVNSLYAFNEGVYDEGVSENGVYNIPECLLSIRREACCAFAGLEDVEASNINRNAYLELLATTRLNKHLESRTSLAEKSAVELDYLLAFLIVVVIVSALYAVRMFRRYKRHELLYSASLRKLQLACHHLLASLPRQATDKEELCLAVSSILNSYMGDLSGVTRYSIAVPFKADDYLPNRYEFQLQYIGSEHEDVLYVAAEYPLSREKHSILVMAVPYIAVAVDEGMRLADISDERVKAEEERRAYSIYLAEHKRENLLKRVSVSVIMGMRPFMERISRELSVLVSGCQTDDMQRKFHYIAELTRKLDDFNIILERWIKMRRGELHLQVENFQLSDVFDIVQKSRLLLEKHGLSFEVKGGEDYVKADKALTLFMVNTLVDNAAKFTPEGGKITIESIERDNYVEVAVADNGIGLSKQDIDRILNEKVYDASDIGNDNGLLSGKKKGGGFGLMNCKGIIEKYRKSGELFSVCSMNIESVKGKGSRFSFRLPKGIMRVLVLVLSMLPASLFAHDDILGKVSSYADSVYYCNIEKDYEGAFAYAGHALELLNGYYREKVGGDDTLSLVSGTANEIEWWREELFADSLIDGIYYNILDIRNEVAVASLAMQKWNSHRYNNYVYTSLYRLVHEDKGVAEHYATVQSALNYRTAAVASLLFVLLLLLMYIIVSYVRNNVILRKNERVLAEVNRSVLQAATGDKRVDVKVLLQSVAREIFSSMGENMRMSRVAIMLRLEDDAKPVVSEAGETELFSKGDTILMLGVIDSGEKFVSNDGMTSVWPLYVNAAGERTLAGALEVVTMRPLVDDEKLNIELVANYTASVVYHALVRVADSYMALEEIEEQTERVKLEENRLHVQNMVLDNCLSTLKHETVYYPSRIRAVAEQAAVGNSAGSAVNSMRELMDYYSSVFGILSNCAKRELDDRCFMLSKVELQALFENAGRYAERLKKKSGKEISFSFEPTSAVVIVDSDLIGFLIESLLDAAFKIEGEGKLLLRASDGDDEVKVELADNRAGLSSEELADLFIPSQRNIASDGTVSGMEYLIAKEIVRLHEDNTGHRGSRLEARADVSGTVILFTLPKQ